MNPRRNISILLARCPRRGIGTGRRARVSAVEILKRHNQGFLPI